MNEDKEPKMNEDKEPKDAGEAVLGCLSSVGILILGLVLSPCPAFVAYTIWRWFGVGKLGAPEVPFCVVGGLLEGASVLRLRGVKNGSHEVTVTSTLIGFVIVPAIILGLARIWLAFA